MELATQNVKNFHTYGLYGSRKLYMLCMSLYVKKSARTAAKMNFNKILTHLNQRIRL